MVWDEMDELQYPLKGHLLARKRKGELSIVGGNCISVNKDDKGIVVIGTESGSMFKCAVY